MGRNETREVLELLMQDPAVSYVTDTKTEEIGPGVFRFKADVGWDGATLAARYIERIGRDRLLQRLRAALKSPSPHEIDRVLQGYGKGIVRAVGAEVDRIEAEIQEMNPVSGWGSLGGGTGCWSAALFTALFCSLFSCLFLCHRLRKPIIVPSIFGDRNRLWKPPGSLQQQPGGGVALPPAAARGWGSPSFNGCQGVGSPHPTTSCVWPGLSRDWLYHGRAAAVVALSVPSLWHVPAAPHSPARSIPLPSLVGTRMRTRAHTHTHMCALLNSRVLVCGGGCRCWPLPPPPPPCCTAHHPSMSASML
mmetsp:Transcript_3669/g.10316  ORF Transcript_3669/g.10316 Transcript_3669/m.10316 type:complete len:306 (-) Transcript_3669:2083-3000(-)